MKKFLTIILCFTVILGTLVCFVSCNTGDNVPAFNIEEQTELTEGSRVVVVLGNKLNNDGSFANVLITRMELTMELYQNGNVDYIILSGGVANKKAGISEADAMFNYLIAAGIPDNVLIIENKSMTTKENAKLSVPIAKQYNARELIICTSSEHMYRNYLNPRALFLKQCSGTSINLYYYTN